jgi:hypothetical protein
MSMSLCWGTSQSWMEVNDREKGNEPEQRKNKKRKKQQNRERESDKAMGVYSGINRATCRE